MTMRVLQRITMVASFCLVVSLGAAACTKKAPAPAPPPPEPAAAPAAPPAPPPPPPAPAPAAPRALTEEELFAQKTLEQLNAEKPLGDVFFDLDQSSIREDGRATLTANATWMKRWTNTRITIEGHCDERGTAEYNLGLGDRRAQSVKAYLVSLGIAADRITAVSKGKESPVCSDKNEACWQRNRRGGFIITAK
jgi:peptidoglycan-associated lipoprotein